MVTNKNIEFTKSNQTIFIHFKIKSCCSDPKELFHERPFNKIFVFLSQKSWTSMTRKALLEMCG